MNDKEKKFSRKDIAIIIASVIALAIILIIVLFTRKQESVIEEELNTISEEIANGTYGNGERTTEEMDSLVINEVNQGGWIELYNSDSAAIDLSGYSVYVGNDNLYTFDENTRISAASYIVIELGTAIAGEAENTVVSVRDTSGEIVRSIVVPQLASGESYGCLTDGAIQLASIESSKGEANANANELSEVTDELTFSVPSGFYTTGFKLYIAAPEGSTIYYTTDGSVPTTESEVYEDCIDITTPSSTSYTYAMQDGTGYYYSSFAPTSLDMGTIVRAFAVDSKGNSSEIVTKAYYIGLAGNSDYKDISVISIVGSPYDLFGYYEGIYVSGKSREDAIIQTGDGSSAGNFFNGRHINARLDYFEEGKDLSFSGDVLLSIDYDLSITDSMKSFSIDGDGAWDGSSLQTFFNSDSGKLTLRTNGIDNSFKLRDYVISELVADTKAPMPYIKPCIVFINGEYWGLYMLESQYDEDFIQDKYGIDEEVVIYRNGFASTYEYTSLYTDFYDFVTTTDLSIDENYEAVKEMMDIDSYLEYVCNNMYFGNYLFSDTGSAAWRTVSSDGTGYADGRWRWILGKMEYTLSVNNQSTYTINSYLQEGVTQNKFLQSLLMNDEFCEQLEITMNQMIENNYESENAVLLVENTVNSLQKAISSSYARYSKSDISVSFTNDVATIEYFLSNRANYILGYTAEIAQNGGDLESIIEAENEVQAEAAEVVEGEEETDNQEDNLVENQDDSNNG